jgi:hypothetical protein
MYSNRNFTEKFLYKKNLYNIDKIMELRENWQFIFPESKLQAIPQQMIASAKDANYLTILCKSELFLDCYNEREEIKNRINIYFAKVCIESIKVLAQTDE